jgi:hypothetical protein
MMTPAPMSSYDPRKRAGMPRGAGEPIAARSGGGLMDAAKMLQSKGRHNDKVLAHISPNEASLLSSIGGGNTINPDTGLPEFFNADYYLQQNPDVAAAVKAGGFASALDHYNAYGQKEGRATSANDKFYLQNNPDVAAAVKAGDFHTGEQHLGAHGWKEGRQYYEAPGNFDSAAYLKANPDVAAEGVDAFTHYMRHGAQEGRALGLEEKKPVTPTAPGAPPPPAWTDRDDSVQNALMSLMSKESPLMRQAETAGLTQANRRGMLNSSMSAQASQEAAYRAALPISMQDASQNYGKNLSRQNFDQALNMQQDQQGFLASQSALDREFRGGQAGLDRTFRSAEAGLDRGLQQTLASWQLGSSDRNAAANVLSQMEVNYQNMFRTIMANPDLDAQTRAEQLQSAQRLRDTQIDFVQQLWDIELQWPKSA